jgi:hypothetical protein
MISMLKILNARFCVINFKLFSKFKKTKMEYNLEKNTLILCK